MNQSNIPLGGKLCILLPIFMAILLSPLAFGGATPVTALFFDALLMISALLWAICNGFEKRWPKFSGWIVASLVTLAVLSLLQLVNARAFLDRDSWELVENGSATGWLPGTVDWTSSFVAIRHGVALACGLLVLVDFASDRAVRWWVLRAAAVSGFVVAVIGISQKAGNSPAMLWSTPEQSGNWFFGAFHYHANAGAFLNLCWPAALALWMRYCHEPDNGLRRSVWLSVLFVTFLAVFVNTSKGAQLVAFILLAIVLVRFRQVIFWRGRNWKVAAASSMAIVIAGFILVLPGMMMFYDRWVTAENSFFGRLEMYAQALALTPEFGFWGAGAGTFRYVFPAFSEMRESAFGDLYLHAHQDYLQALIEWGWIGCLALFVPVLVAFRRAYTRARMTADAEVIEFSTSCSMIAMVGVLIHAGFDFPLQVPSIQILCLGYFAFLWTGNAPKIVPHHPQPADEMEEDPEEVEVGPEINLEEWEDAELDWEAPVAQKAGES